MTLSRKCYQIGGVSVKSCKSQSVDIDVLSIERGVEIFACYDLFQEIFISFISVKRCSYDGSKSNNFNAFIQLTFSRQKLSRIEIKMFHYSGHQNNNSKRNSCVVVHSHDLINNSCSFCEGTAYLAIMLQTFWHIAEAY